MWKRVFIALAFVSCLNAANFKLYMKDGTFQLVREYKVEGDRVKFYATERGEYEEIPSELVDLKRTDAESSAKRATIEKQAKEISEEDAARRDLQKEILKIPQDSGAYMLENDQLRIFKLADASVHNPKGRNLLSALSPLPMIPGKATLEMNLDHSENIVKEARPEFYLQLSGENSFALVKLTPKGGVRIAERITIVPVSKEVIEERDVIQTFSKQLTESGLYKIWPQEDLPKGDYALMEYREGKIDGRFWDFRIQ